MSTESERPSEESAEVTPLPSRNEVHYDRARVRARRLDARRSAYMRGDHGITPDVANEALGDPNRVVIDPDYNSGTVRASGSSATRPSPRDIITVIAL